VVGGCIGAGNDDEIRIAAREAGRAYLRRVVLGGHDGMAGLDHAALLVVDPVLD
jgi:hypothetical protein